MDGVERERQEICRVAGLAVGLCFSHRQLLAAFVALLIHQHHSPSTPTITCTTLHHANSFPYIPFIITQVAVCVHALHYHGFELVRGVPGRRVRFIDGVGDFARRQLAPLWRSSPRCARSGFPLSLQQGRGLAGPQFDLPPFPSSFITRIFAVCASSPSCLGFVHVSAL